MNNTAQVLEQKLMIRSIESFLSYLNSLDEENISEEDVFKIQTKLERIPTLTDFKMNLLSLADVENLDVWDDFEEKSSNAVSIAKQLLAKNSSSSLRDLDQMSIKSGNSSFANNNSHLPKLTLPTFNGDISEWPRFRDLYISMIHKNDSIDNIQKFYYLKSSLSNTALHVIDPIVITAESYHEAWELVFKRFENKRIATNHHVKALVNLSAAPANSAVKLRTLVDSMKSHMCSLAALGEQIDKSNVLFVYLMTQKLDCDLRDLWDKECFGLDNIPTTEQFLNFITQRAELLELTNSRTNSRAVVRKESRAFSAVEASSCPFCNTHDHKPFQCSVYMDMTVDKRWIECKRKKLCLNCLSTFHFVKDCKGGSCKTCHKKHHTSLHTNATARTDNVVTEPIVAFSNNDKSFNAMLSTVLINVTDFQGRQHTSRALLDSGSQSNFITTRLFNKLGLRANKVHYSIKGINRRATAIHDAVKVQLKSKNSSFNSEITCLVIPSITEPLPNAVIDVNKLKIPGKLRLADPTFNIPDDIDILLGVELFWAILGTRKIKLGNSHLALQQSQLGWIVTGHCVSDIVRNETCLHTSTRLLQNRLQTFWEIEESPLVRALSLEEEACEKHFVQHVRQDETGRFIVRIPLKESPERLGDSKTYALKRFYALEKRLAKDSSLRQQYIDFMNTYEHLGHMSRVESDDDKLSTYFLPHHGVLKLSSTTTKLRVVFDASMTTTSGVSFNNIQSVGPTIQSSLLSILLRFRTHKYVATSDIAMMYRQVLVEPAQRSLQRIIWRSSPDLPIQVYNLNTVTYGTTSAPYLAIRTLCQLAHQNQTEFPIASETILKDFYVDDLLTGAASVDLLIKLCKEIDHILSKGCFKLRKWVSNHPDFLIKTGLEPPSSDEAVHLVSEQNKTLGILWLPSTDSLSHNVPPLEHVNKVTKRIMLSYIAQIFDPLGLLGPVVVLAKIWLQKLWQLQIEWDTQVPDATKASWFDFCTQVQNLKEFTIPRHVLCIEPTLIELHGFCDASLQAYGACVYLRSINANGKARVQLLCAKSRVAPLKALTVPRLELCGATVLTDLTKQVKASLNLKVTRTLLWTDSTIVLAWIKTPSNQLKTFVANRVAHIQRNTNPECWSHVSTNENPADLISRGLDANELRNASLWWHGPAWLQLTPAHWPIPNELEILDLPEIKPPIIINAHTATVHDIFTRFSNLNRLVRIVAYCLRFISNTRAIRCNRTTGVLTALELETATNKLIRVAQEQEFSKELTLLHKGQSVGKNSNLYSLQPFIDSLGVIRVGGRLKQSDISYDVKHPILLPKAHAITKLIMTAKHFECLHPGPQGLLYYTREKYWPISGRTLAKQITRECIICMKHKPTSYYAPLGDLPAARITAVYPFSTTGVDYAGPVMIKNKYGRNSKLLKSYIALFVCFTTKAVHLELVTDLTTQAFLLSFQRFVARRGTPAQVFSDNGTNFVGARNYLRELGQLLSDTSFQNDVCTTVESRGIAWKFIPPRSPHHGGLWEAAVKSVKHHLRRVMHNSNLTFEDLYTVLTQIESILNSRPLTALSTNPNDLYPLCPGHFLIGRPPVSTLGAAEDTPIKIKLTAYNIVQQMRATFWKRWHKEYLNTLQQRTKWQQGQPRVPQLGDLVVLKDENAPTYKWITGRVLELHPGKDGIVRVVSIKTPAGTYQRAIQKICHLQSPDLE